MRRSGGFILTLELLVLLTIFSAVAIAILYLAQKYFVEKVGNDFGGKIRVYSDGSNPIADNPLTPEIENFLGTAISFNGTESPVLLYRDGSITPPLAALLGVRPQYLTSRTVVYFATSDCSGTGYLLNPRDPDAWQDGPVSDVYSLQGWAYGMGPNNTLFRAQGVAPAPTVAIESRWVSEDYAQTCDDNSGAGLGISVRAIAAANLGTFNGAFPPPYWIPDASAGSIPANFTNPTPEAAVGTPKVDPPVFTAPGAESDPP